MYSWAQREDFKVIDEPFYAYYLKTFNITSHPGTEEILASQPTDLNTVIDSLKQKERNLFIKNMAHHIGHLTLDFCKNFENIIFIRNPRQLIASFAQVIDQPNMKDIGVKNQYEIYQKLEKAIVLDSGQLLANPSKVLEELCQRIGIDFDPSVLNWEAGARIEDGVWAPHWYSNVHKTTGFGIQKTSSRSMPEKYENLYHEALPYYNELFEHSIKA